MDNIINIKQMFPIRESQIDEKEETVIYGLGEDNNMYMWVGGGWEFTE